MNGFTETCYACEEPGITDEHAPPRCIFPAGCEDLIKVPSCPKHNSQKSKDDEFFRHIIIAAEGGNELALQAYEPVIRSFERRPHIMKTFIPQPQPLTNRQGETVSFRVDLKRFERSVRAITRALYYHEFRQKLHAKLSVVWGAFRTQDRQSLPFLGPTLEAQKQFGPLSKGDHPRIFQYGFNDTVSRKQAHCVCRLRFFEGIPICVVWRK